MSIKVFSIARLKIDNEDFALRDFSAIEEEYNEQLQQNEKNRVVKKNLFSNRFISLYFEEGNVYPRPEVVHNQQTDKDESNPILSEGAKNEMTR